MIKFYKWNTFPSQVYLWMGNLTYFCRIQDNFFYLDCEAIGTAATPGRLCQPRVILMISVEKQMKCRLAGETKVLGENLPQRPFCPSQNPTWADPGLNPGRRGGKLATNRLSYGAVLSKTLTYGAQPFLRSCQLCSYSKNSQRFMEPKGSSPCSQEPSIGPYPELDRSSPYHPNLSLSKICFNIVHPPTILSS
jgi:hypothetical protein